MVIQWIDSSIKDHKPQQEILKQFLFQS